MKNKMADMSQVNIEEMVRKYGEEETVGIMKVIMENNAMMLKLQKQIVELQVVEEERKKKAKKKIGGEGTRKKRV